MACVIAMAEALAAGVPGRYMFTNVWMVCPRSVLCGHRYCRDLHRKKQFASADGESSNSGGFVCESVMTVFCEGASALGSGCTLATLVKSCTPCIASTCDG